MAQDPEKLFREIRRSLKKNVKPLKQQLSSKAQTGETVANLEGGIVEPIRYTVVRGIFDPTNFFEEIFAGAFEGLLTSDPKLYTRLLMKFKDSLKNLQFSEAELKLMRDHVRKRIFVHGKGNAPAPNRTGEYGYPDTQMRRVSDKVKDSRGYSRAAKTKFPYRYKTGRLYDSVKVTQTSSNFRMIITYRREKAVIDSLIAKFGNFFVPTQSDVKLYQWLILKKLGFLQGQSRPAKTAFGGVGTPPSFSKIDPDSALDKKDIRSFLKRFD